MHTHSVHIVFTHHHVTHTYGQQVELLVQAAYSGGVSTALDHIRARDDAWAIGLRLFLDAHDPRAKHFGLTCIKVLRARTLSKASTRKHLHTLYTNTMYAQIMHANQRKGDCCRTTYNVPQSTSPHRKYGDRCA
jgi:hypothetical protein